MTLEWRHSHEDIDCEELARLYQAAVMGYPYSGGGTYWWYYRQEARRSTRLREALASLYRSSSHRPRHR